MSGSKWSVISALAAVAAVLVPVLLFFVGRDSKQLSVETVSRAVLIDLAQPGLSSLKLTYKEIDPITPCRCYRETRTHAERAEGRCGRRLTERRTERSKASEGAKVDRAFS